MDKNSNFGRRVLSEVFEISTYFFVLFIWYTFLLILMKVIGNNDPLSESWVLVFKFLFLVLPLAIIIGLNVLEHSKNGGNFAYKKYNLRLVLENGENLGLIRIILRTIGKFIYFGLFASFIVAFMHYYLLVLTKGERNFLDHIFGTKAVFK